MPSKAAQTDDGECHIKGQISALFAEPVDWHEDVRRWQKQGKARAVPYNEPRRRSCSLCIGRIEVAASFDC